MTILLSGASFQSVAADVAASNGWQKFSNHGFEYSFYYPDTWKVLALSDTVIISNFGPFKNEDHPDTLVIKQVDGKKITDSDAKFGTISYYYDDNSRQWMKVSDGEGGESYDAQGNPYYVEGSTAPQPAKPVFKTISGLPVFSGTGRWGTVIIPLTHERFLLLNMDGTGSGFSQVLYPLAAAVTELDANIPESAISSAVEKEIKADAAPY